MAVLRKVKKTDYTIIDNNIFKNTKLSLKAKGMICTMLSLPDNWVFSEIGLTQLSNDSRTGIRSTLKELQEFGYLKRERSRNEKGILGDTIYTIYEEPMYQNNTLVEPVYQKPMYEKPTLDKKHNKILNNKELNNKKESIKEKYFNNDELNEIFIEFLQLRKKLKAVNSDRAINSLLKKLNNYDDDTKYKMIEQSIVSSWKNVYEVKENKRKEIHYEEL